MLFAQMAINGIWKVIRIISYSLIYHWPYLSLNFKSSFTSSITRIFLPGCSSNRCQLTKALSKAHQRSPHFDFCSALTLTNLQVCWFCNSVSCWTNGDLELRERSKQTRVASFFWKVEIKWMPDLSVLRKCVKTE